MLHDADTFPSFPGFRSTYLSSLKLVSSILIALLTFNFVFFYFALYGRNQEEWMVMAGINRLSVLSHGAKCRPCNSSSDLLIFVCCYWREHPPFDSIPLQDMLSIIFLINFSAIIGQEVEEIDLVGGRLQPPKTCS